MPQYVMVESRDPFERDVPYFYNLARDLAAKGEKVTLFLVQNGALASRKNARNAAKVLLRPENSNVVPSAKYAPAACAMYGSRILGHPSNIQKNYFVPVSNSWANSVLLTFRPDQAARGSAAIPCAGSSGKKIETVVPGLSGFALI